MGGGNPGPKCSSITVEEHAESFTPLIEMLPNVIQTLKGAGKMNLLIELYTYMSTRYMSFLTLDGSKVRRVYDVARER